MASEHARSASPRAQRAAQILRDAYGGMHAWQVWVDEDPALGFDGQVSIEPRYRRARITIRPGLPAEHERQTLAHELAHVLLSDINVVVDRITDLLKPRLGVHAQELYTDALEPVCDQLARIVCASIPPEAFHGE